MPMMLQLGELFQEGSILMGEWFVDWFNSPECMHVYRHRNLQDAETLINLIFQTVDLIPGMKVLDMACGSGRHSVLFAKRGCKVTAFDYSDLLLGEARKNAETENINIEFIKADIRKFSFDKKFDLAVNLFTSFGYFDEDEENFEVIKSAYNHLKDSGFFVLDFLNSEFVKNHLVKESVDKMNDSLVKQERFIEKNRVKKRITVKKDNRTELYYENVRLYTHIELIDNINAAGFKIKRISGDFAGHNYDSETSPRVIIIASK